MNDIELRPSVLLSLQRALLGMITPNIRAITCGWNNDKIVIKFIYDGRASEDDKEEASVVETEVMADFPEHIVELKIAEIPAPNPYKNELLQACVYARYEGW